MFTDPMLGCTCFGKETNGKTTPQTEFPTNVHMTSEVKANLEREQTASGLRSCQARSTGAPQNLQQVTTRTNSLPVFELVDVVHHLLRAVPRVILVLLLDKNKNGLRHLVGKGVKII